MTSSATPIEHFETRWWHQAGDKVVCTLCPRECHIKEGSRGFCFVRANVGGELVLTTYGRSSGFCIDPIEKKPLNHFLPGSSVLSLGTAGCNLGCKFCQNWDISKSREMDTLAGQAGPESIVQAAKDMGCRSIAFTYNDPTIWAEYAIDIAKVARAEGIRTVAVTAGYISPDARREFYQWMDAANVDLKAFTETFYRKLTQTHLQPILDTLKYLKHETDVWFELTNLMIPGENDSEDETRQMCDWIVNELGVDVPVHFTAFHPDFKMRDKERTPESTLARARDIAINAGVQYAYVGNVHDVARQSTYCHSCGELLIERDWYELGVYGLEGNQCQRCSANVPGVFDAGAREPGDWGRKRQPIRIQETPRQYVSLSVGALDAKLSDPDQQQMAREDPLEPDSQPTLSSSPTAATSPRLDFTDEQCATLLRFTRDRVRQAVQPNAAVSPLPDDLAAAPAFGVFVTLERQGRLRACRGRWHGIQDEKRSMSGQGAFPLGELLAEVTHDTTVSDPRFPTITAEEVDLLSLDISLMHDPQKLAGDGEQRVDHVRVGEHGLMIKHPRGRGLLLPQVATDNRWNALTFLQQLARKAGLPVDAWKDAAAEITTFPARVLEDAAPATEFDPAVIAADDWRLLIGRASLLLKGADEAAVKADLPESLTTKQGQDLGMLLFTPGNLSGIAIGPNYALIDLAVMAARSLGQAMKQRSVSESPVRLVMLQQPLQLKAIDFPHRFQMLGGHAILARGEGAAWGLKTPSQPFNRNIVDDALGAAGIRANAWRQAEAAGKRRPRVSAFSLFGFDARQVAGGGGQRPAARAGQFYPGDANEMNREVDRWLEEGRQATTDEPANYRAVMLPHAGWRYCGETIGRTLAAVKDVPDRVVIVGPKHTPHGAAMSVPPHATWQLPGGSVAIDTGVVSFLLNDVQGLECEAAAHEMEHAVEVLLPFLRRRNPNVRVTPIVIGRVDDDAWQRLGASLEKLRQTFVARGETPPLLVISSDMNHFASETEGRRRDALALDAMKAGDPNALVAVCRANDISMCGVLPAAVVMHGMRQTGAIDPREIHYSTSAKTSGDTTSVVGYAGVVIP